MTAPIDDQPEFTEEQLQAALQRVGEDARREAFSAGEPIMVIRDGRFKRIFPDGMSQDLGPVQTVDVQASAK